LEPDAQPASITPYTAIDDSISMKRIPHGGSASCSAVRWPKIDTVPPRGTIEKTRNAGTTARNGASRYTRLSAFTGSSASLKNNLVPSASDWSMP